MSAVKRCLPPRDGSMTAMLWVGGTARLSKLTNRHPFRAIKFLLICGFVPAAAAQQSGCYTFVAKKELFVSCGTDAHRVLLSIAPRFLLETVAVTSERQYIAFTRSWTVSSNATTMFSDAETVLIHVPTNTRTIRKGIRNLISTCGTVLPLSAQATDSPLDVITGEPLPPPPFQWLRCSADRSVLLGITTKSPERLMVQRPGGPMTQVGIVKDGATFNINISADGSHIVHHADGRLCVTNNNTLQGCLPWPTAVELMSVNDEGGVLFTLGTPQGCYYKSALDFYPKPFPGATDENLDECLGIAYWQPGMATAVTKQLLGRRPQWVTSSFAAELRRWSRLQAPARSPAAKQE